MAVHGSLYKVQSVQRRSAWSRHCYGSFRSLLHLRVFFHERRASWARAWAWKRRASLRTMRISESWDKCSSISWDRGVLCGVKGNGRYFDAPESRVLMGYRRTLWPLAMCLTSAALRQTVERVHAKVLERREKHEPLLLVLRSWEDAASHVSSVKQSFAERLIEL